MSEHAATSTSLIFLWLAIMLLAAKLSSFIEKWGFPTVLGELIVGIILGSLGYLGFHDLEPIKTNGVINFLSQLGVVVLLFQIGLESNIQQMKKIGGKALAVAITGVVATFALVYITIPLLLPDASSLARLFLAGTFTSTSVGISARVFRDLGQLKSSAAQLVLGAAVMDDIIGLIILAVLSAMVTTGSVNPIETGLIFGKAVGFLIASIIVGQIIAPYLTKGLSKVHTGTGMKLTLAISLGLIFAYLAQEIDLAPIIGAFAAGLILDPVHFKHFAEGSVIADIKEKCQDLTEVDRAKIEATLQHHAEHHVEEIIEPLSIFLVPLFFVLTGMNVDLATLAKPEILLTAFGFVVVAILGKLAAGLMASGVRKSVVGWGMVPRGEVQLIFASMGLGLGVITSDVYTIVVIVVVATTLLTPIVLSILLRNNS